MTDETEKFDAVLLEMTKTHEEDLKEFLDHVLSFLERKTVCFSTSHTESAEKLLDASFSFLARRTEFFSAQDTQAHKALILEKFNYFNEIAEANRMEKAIEDKNEQDPNTSSSANKDKEDKNEQDRNTSSSANKDEEKSEEDAEHFRIDGHKITVAHLRSLSPKKYDELLKQKYTLLKIIFYIRAKGNDKKIKMKMSQSRLLAWTNASKLGILPEDVIAVTPPSAETYESIDYACFYSALEPLGLRTKKTKEEIIHALITLGGNRYRYR